MVVCDFLQECILKLSRTDPCSKCRCKKPGPGSKKATLIKKAVWIFLVARILISSAGIGLHSHYAWKAHKDFQAEEAKRLAYQDSEAIEELLEDRRRMLVFQAVMHMILVFEYVVFQLSGLLKGKVCLLQIWMIATLVNPFPVLIFWIHYGPNIEPFWQAVEIGFWLLSVVVQFYEVWILLVYCGVLKGDEELEFGNIEDEIGVHLSRRELEEQAMYQRMKDMHEERIASGHVHVYEYAQWYLLENRRDLRMQK